MPVWPAEQVRSKNAGNDAATLPAQGTFAPVFMALGIAAGVIGLWSESRTWVWLGLGGLALGLGFSRYTRRLLSRAGG